MNSAVTADSLYSVSWRPAFGAADGAPIGHVLIRRLDDGSDGPGGPGGPGEDTAPVAELPPSTRTGTARCWSGWKPR